MPLEVLNRFNWYGEPKNLGDTLRQMAQVCRTQDEVLETSDQWKAAMIEKGSTRDHLGETVGVQA